MMPCWKGSRSRWGRRGGGGSGSSPGWREWQHPASVGGRRTQPQGEEAPPWFLQVSSWQSSHSDAILTNFDPAYWEYEGAKAKIVVNYLRSDLKILRKAFYHAWEKYNRVWCLAVLLLDWALAFSRIFYPEHIWQIFHMKLCWFFSQKRCAFCE